MTYDIFTLRSPLSADKRALIMVDTPRVGSTSRSRRVAPHGHILSSSGHRTTGNCKWAFTSVQVSDRTVFTLLGAVNNTYLFRAFACSYSDKTKESCIGDAACNSGVPRMSLQAYNQTFRTASGNRSICRTDCVSLARHGRRAMERLSSDRETL